MVQTFDLKERRCISSEQGYGNYGASSVAFSKLGNTLAVGTRSGVLHIHPAFQTRTKDSLVSKEIKNLSTSITSLCSNHTGELFGFASNEKQNAVRLVRDPKNLFLFMNSRVFHVFCILVILAVIFDSGRIQTRFTCCYYALF